MLNFGKFLLKWKVYVVGRIWHVVRHFIVYNISRYFELNCIFAKTKVFRFAEILAGKYSTRCQTNLASSPTFYN